MARARTSKAWPPGIVSRPEVVAGQKAYNAVISRVIDAPVVARGYVSLWIDDPKVGCGRRGFFCYEIGRKWVSLFYPPLCCRIRITITAYRDLRPMPDGYERKKMIARIKLNNVMFNTTPDGKTHTPSYVRDVLAGIRSKKL